MLAVKPKAVLLLGVVCMVDWNRRDCGIALQSFATTTVMCYESAPSDKRTAGRVSKSYEVKVLPR